MNTGFPSVTTKIINENFTYTFTLNVDLCVIQRDVERDYYGKVNCKYNSFF